MAIVVLFKSDQEDLFIRFSLYVDYLVASNIKDLHAEMLLHTVRPTNRNHFCCHMLSHSLLFNGEMYISPQRCIWLETFGGENILYIFPVFTLTPYRSSACLTVSNLKLVEVKKRTNITEQILQLNLWKKAWYNIYL